MSENQHTNTNLSEEEEKNLKIKARIQGTMAFNLGVMLLVFTPIIFVLSRYVKEDIAFYLGFFTFPLGIGFLLFGRNLKKLSN